MPIVNLVNLKHYLGLNYNVLFSGAHGVGKTTLIHQVFQEANLRYITLSGATLDPWVDFVGIPRTIERPGMAPVLDLVRPKFIQDDEIDAIFIDELNRAAPKVMNAIMELIQFKSINGHKLNNLKVIWAAINPEDDDETYSVNKIDPAQMDRFHVKIDVPYEVDKSYFMKKYPVTGEQFMLWWKELPDEVKKSVSPRRLDYVADAYKNGCRIEDFLPAKSNPKKLRTLLNTLPFHDLIKGVKSEAEALMFLKDVNNVTRLLNMVNNKEKISIEFFSKYAEKLPKEILAPFAQAVAAHRKGQEVVKNAEDLINNIKPEQGDNRFVTYFNTLNLDNIYLNGMSDFKIDITSLYANKPHLVRKISNSCNNVLIKCHAGTIKDMFWGVNHALGQKTNFQNLCEILRDLDKGKKILFTEKQRSWINSKLFKNNIVTVQNWSET